MFRRRLTARKGQVLVSVPREVQEFLSVGPGEIVYWQITNRGSAVLSRTAKRAAGRPVDPDLTRAVRHRDRLVKRLRAKLESRPVRVYNEGYNQGRMAHMGELVKLSVKLDDVRDGYERMEGELARLRAQLSLRPVPRHRARRAPRPVDAIPLPDLPSTPASVERGADTLGQPAPGVPSES